MKRVTLSVVTIVLALGLVSGVRAQDYYKGFAGALSVGSLTSAGNITAVTNVIAQGTVVRVGDTGEFDTPTRSAISFPADGILAFKRNDTNVGVDLKFDALPTVASGFGTSPAITAGSTALAGSVNVGTGGVATSGVINFNGAAFPSAPFCTATPTTSNIVQRVASSTTQLTLTVTSAWTASDVIFFQCISSK